MACCPRPGSAARPRPGTLRRSGARDVRLPGDPLPAAPRTVAACSPHLRLAVLWPGGGLAVDRPDLPQPAATPAASSPLRPAWPHRPGDRRAGRPAGQRGPARTARPRAARPGPAAAGPAGRPGHRAPGQPDRALATGHLVLLTVAAGVLPGRSGPATGHPAAAPTPAGPGQARQGPATRPRRPRLARSGISAVSLRSPVTHNHRADEAVRSAGLAAPSWPGGERRMTR